MLGVLDKIFSSGMLFMLKSFFQGLTDHRSESDWSVIAWHLPTSTLKKGSYDCALSIIWNDCCYERSVKYLNQWTANDFGNSSIIFGADHSILLNYIRFVA